MRKIWAVIRREFVERARTRAFVIGTILGPVFFAVMFILPGYLMSRDTGVKRIAVVDGTTSEPGRKIASALTASRSGQGTRRASPRRDREELGKPYETRCARRARREAEAAAGPRCATSPAGILTAEKQELVRVSGPEHVGVRHHRRDRHPQEHRRRLPPRPGAEVDDTFPGHRQGRQELRRVGAEDRHARVEGRRSRGRRRRLRDPARNAPLRRRHRRGSSRAAPASRMRQMTHGGKDAPSPSGKLMDVVRAIAANRRLRPEEKLVEEWAIRCGTLLDTTYVGTPARQSRAVSPEVLGRGVCHQAGVRRVGGWLSALPNPTANRVVKERLHHRRTVRSSRTANRSSSATT